MQRLSSHHLPYPQQMPQRRHPALTHIKLI